jgi:LysR family nitrogen assimilation transcriptional regulator
MNVRQLKYFVSVVEAGNMTRAAEQLNVAQTALGMQIRQLEEDLRVTLLIRHSRGVEPTKAGALLYSRAIEILALIDSARSEIASCNNIATESLRFGMTPALMLIVGAEIALNVREQLSNVLLTFVEDMSHILIEKAGRGELDLILCYDIPDLPHLSRTPLLQDDLVLVTAPRSSNAVQIPFVEALEETLAMPEEGDSVRSAVERTAGSLGLELRVSFDIRSISAIKGLVERGAACSILPFAAVANEVRGGKLEARPIIMPVISRTLFLAAANHRGPLRCEAGMVGVVRSSLKPFLEALGPLAHPLWVRTS